MSTDKAAPMREDVDALLNSLCRDGQCRDDSEDGDRNFCGECDFCLRMRAARVIQRQRLAHTARPDAGDDKAEVERLRGLLIDPGTPPWEDARAVLVAELRKNKRVWAGDCVERGEPADVPSHIALNLIAQAARRSDAGDEDVERLRAALKPFADCCEQIEEGESDEEWAKFRLLIGDYRRARAALAAMREGGDRGMVEREAWKSDPLNTAPKDGTYVLFAGTNFDGGMAVVHWSKDLDWWCLDDGKNFEIALRAESKLTGWRQLPALSPEQPR